MPVNNQELDRIAAQKLAANKDPDEFTLDSILLKIGQLGTFQIMIFLLIIIPMTFNAICSVTFIFTASTVVYRCNITECDGPASQYREPWTDFAIPAKGRDMDSCNRYINSELSGNPNQTDVCVAENYQQQQNIKCPNDNFIFRDDEVTISNTFGIFCGDEWKLSMVGTVNNIGQFVGIPLGGYIADRFGRGTSLALGGFLASFMGIIRSFSPNYLFFLALEFLDNVASSTLYSTCFIIGIELVGPKRRVAACSLITTFYAIGEVLMALVAKYFPDWRLMLRIIYIPALIHGLYFWILPESVRWLLSQGKEREASAILKRAARVNKRKLSDYSLDKLLAANREKLLTASEGKFPIKQAFGKLYWRIANASFCWITHVLVYYGLSLSAVALDGDKYLNFVYIALIEIPGFFLPLLVMDRFGRRYMLFGCMLICGSCCLGTIFTTADQQTLRLVLFLLGKLIITASFQVLYFFTAEIFPTNLRNSLLSFCSMMGRFGSMIAPQTPLMAKYYENGPALLFTITAVTSGCLCLLFPETTNIILPSTLEEADSIGEKKSEQAGQAQS